jgi:hypothetical protein
LNKKRKQKNKNNKHKSKNKTKNSNVSMGDRLEILRHAGRGPYPACLNNFL